MRSIARNKAKGLSVLGAGALAIGMLSVAAAPALAAPGDGGTGSITVYKLAQTQGDVGENDGQEITLSGVDYLEAGFKLCPVENVDLAKSADWDRLKNLTATATSGSGVTLTENPAPTTGSAASLGSCGAEGFTSETSPYELKFDGLTADKAYVLYESTPAAGATPIDPTIVTIPYPGADTVTGTGDWNYNVYVYPKNSVPGHGATKEGKIIGDRVTFDVTVPIQPLAEGHDYTQFEIEDTLSSVLTAGSASAVLKAADDTAVGFVKDTDYEVTITGNVVRFKVLSLDLLDDNIGGNIILTINATAKSSVATGTLENQAMLIVNGEESEGPEVINPGTFYNGNYILKEAVNKGASANVPLAGVEFDIYKVDESTVKCAADASSYPAASLAYAALVTCTDGKTTARVLE